MSEAMATEAVPVEKGRSLWGDARRRLRKNHFATGGAIFLCLIATTCVFGPMLSPYDYDEVDPALLGGTKEATPTAATGFDLSFSSRDLAQGPRASHWLGTDSLGRDQLTRIMYGGRVSLGVGLAATAVSLTIGLFYGAIAGFVGGRVDRLMMRFVDMLYALPFTIFVIILMVYFGRNIVILFMAIGAIEWLTMARIVRGQVLSVREKEYIEATKVMGLSWWRVVTRHVIPNVLGPVVVYTTLTIPNVMLLEAFLSFLGLGVQPPMSSWGSLIHEGAQEMEEHWWLLIFPSLALSATLFSLNFLGDGLRDALDPRMSKD